MKRPVIFVPKWGPNGQHGKHLFNLIEERNLFLAVAVRPPAALQHRLCEFHEKTICEFCVGQSLTAVNINNLLQLVASNAPQQVVDNNSCECRILFDKLNNAVAQLGVIVQHPSRFV